jgi:hypothetical protein
MGTVTFRQNGDGCWPDLKPGTPAVRHATTETTRVELAFLPAGTKSGRPSVTLRVDLEDRETLLLEFTAAEFVTLGRCVQAATDRGS